MKAGEKVREYILQEKVGEGGMAEVWLAHHIHLDKAVALKVMTASMMGTDFNERFLNEARAMARLQHPNILSATEFFVEEGVYYLVMPYIDAGSLEDQIISARGPISIDMALGVSEQILAALDFAHQKGVIHRDVKPSNILMDREGRAYLADFGIALMVGEDRKTRTGTSIGTPHYMSPEQIMRPKTMDHRADVYSYGCVLFEMLCGRPPFEAPEDEGDTDFVIKTGHLQEEIPAPRKLNPSLPLELEGILRKVLEKNPDDRYQGCGQLARALADYQHKDDKRAPATPPKRPSARTGEGIAPPAAELPARPEYEPFQGIPVKRSPIVAIVVAVVAVLLVAVGSWYWMSQALMREFDSAVAQNSLVTGANPAYGAYQKAVQEKGATSSMVVAMGEKARPLLQQKRQLFLDNWYKEGEPSELTWDEYLKLSEWMQKIAPDTENTAQFEYALGNVSSNKRNFREALTHFQNALKGKPNWVLAVNGLGRASRGLEDKASALQFYEQAYSIDPGWHFCVINLADIVADYVKDFPRAEYLYKEALRLAPDRASFHMRVANFFYGQGKVFYPQACDEYKRALGLQAAGTKGTLSPQQENIARARVTKLCGA